MFDNEKHQKEFLRLFGGNDSMDHVLNEIQRQINICFLMLDNVDMEKIEERSEYQSAKALLTAYNKIAKLYYGEDYSTYIKVSVKKELEEYRG